MSDLTSAHQKGKDEEKTTMARLIKYYLNPQICFTHTLSLSLPFISTRHALLVLICNHQSLPPHTPHQIKPRQRQPTSLIFGFWNFKKKEGTGHLEKSSSSKESNKSSTSRNTHGVGSTSLESRSGGLGASSGASSTTSGSTGSSGGGSGVALGGSYASDGGHAGAGSSLEGLGGGAELGDLVLNRGLLVAVWAIVVADEHILVNVAETDVVVAVALALGDAGLVTGNTGVKDTVIFVSSLALTTAFRLSLFTSWM